MPAVNTTAPRPRSRAGEEVWETTTEGTVWVVATSPNGRDRNISVGGRAGERLRISTMDREIAQDTASSEISDPFRNGLLRRVDADAGADPATASEQVFTTEELLVGFAKSAGAFRAFVDPLNELNARRMLEMVEVADASVSQRTYLQGVVAEKFRIHGSTPTYDEMARSGDAAR